MQSNSSLLQEVAIACHTVSTTWLMVPSQIYHVTIAVGFPYFFYALRLFSFRMECLDTIYFAGLTKYNTTVLVFSRLKGSSSLPFITRAMHYISHKDIFLLTTAPGYDFKGRERFLIEVTQTLLSNSLNHGVNCFLDTIVSVASSDSLQTRVFGP